MTVLQYDHVVPYTDLGGRGYFGINAALVEFDLKFEFEQLPTRRNYLDLESSGKHSFDITFIYIFVYSFIYYLEIELHPQVTHMV